MQSLKDVRPTSLQEKGNDKVFASDTHSSLHTLTFRVDPKLQLNNQTYYKACMYDVSVAVQ